MVRGIWNKSKMGALVLAASVGLAFQANSDNIDSTGRNLVPVMIKPVSVTKEGIEYVNPRVDRRTDGIDAKVYREILEESGKREQLPKNKQTFRALSPIVNHLFTGNEGKDGSLSLAQMIISPFRLEREDMYYNVAVESITSLGSDGVLAQYKKRVFTKPGQIERIRLAHDMGSTMQFISFPKNFMKTRRNAIVFHPGRTLEDSVLEEKYGTGPVAGLPAEAKKYEGKTQISALYSCDPDTLEKGKRIGFMVDVYTPPAVDVGDGIEDFLWVKQFFGEDRRFPKKIVVRPYTVKTPSEEDLLEIANEEHAKYGRSLSGIFATPLEIYGERGLEPLLGMDPSTITGEKSPNLKPSKRLPLYSSLIAIDENGKPAKNLPVYRFDEPHRIIGVNWGYSYIDRSGDSATYSFDNAE